MILPILILIVIIILSIKNDKSNSSSTKAPNPTQNTQQKKTVNTGGGIGDFDKKIDEYNRQQQVLRLQAQLVNQTTQNNTNIAPTPTPKAQATVSSRQFKSNWQEYKSVIESNNIKTLYHFTDRANIESIKKYGGLYSWDYCLSNNISIPMPGGDDLSRGLDKRYNLQNFVRTSFTRNHPMMYIALNQQRIKNPVILEIDPEIIYWQNTKYANKNATRNDVSIGSEVGNFKNIRFDIVKQTKHFDLDLIEKPYYQAEILILERIPVEFIKNIDRL